MVIIQAGLAFLMVILMVSGGVIGLGIILALYMGWWCYRLLVSDFR